ncbi:MAG TPA: glycosyltransferase family 4 protein, partial [Candidatus Thermoplasmatota archaeon]|nr:glycosyltransferase family 4 protein [Candidatus Thermoplasmatota archaeon]
MSDGLRLGIASQTPIARVLRTPEEIEEEHGPLPDPIPLDGLVRGHDFSITPGGVARMIHCAIEDVWTAEGVHGEWVTLTNGFSRELACGPFRLLSASLPPEAQARYGQFKEVLWEVINGLPPRIEHPFREGGDFARQLESYSEWSAAGAQVLNERHAAAPFDLFYINDWQQLPQGAFLKGRPRVMHFHAPFADWTPAGWKDFVLHHLKHYESVIVSTHQYVAALKKAGLDVPVHQVYPWIDPDDYPAPPRSDMRAFEEKFRIAPEDEVILNVGRMDPVKGQDRLLRAMPRVLRERPNAKLVLVGNGSFSSSKKAGMGLSKGKLWRGKLEALAKDLGIEDRVVFTGHIPHSEVVPAFHRANVFAFPSVAEGFGLAVAEAWIARKPAVVNVGAGISEIITDGENGLVVDAADADALAGALVQVLASPDGGRAMGEAGYRTALEVCDVRHGGWQVLEVLEATLE